MTLELVCPACGRTGLIPEALAGQMVRCRECGATCQAPAMEAAAAAPTQADRARRRTESPGGEGERRDWEGLYRTPRRRGGGGLVIAAATVVSTLLGVAGLGFGYSFWSMQMATRLLDAPVRTEAVSFQPGAVAGRLGWFTTTLRLTDSRAELNGVEFAVPQIDVRVAPTRIEARIPETRSTGWPRGRITLVDGVYESPRMPLAPLALPKEMTVRHEEMRVRVNGADVTATGSRVSVVRETHRDWDTLAFAWDEVKIDEPEVKGLLRGVTVETTQAAREDGRLAVTLVFAVGEHSVRATEPPATYKSGGQRFTFSGSILGDNTTNFWRTLPNPAEDPFALVRYRPTYRPRYSHVEWVGDAMQFTSGEVRGELDGVHLTYTSDEGADTITDTWSLTAEGVNARAPEGSTRGERVVAEGRRSYSVAWRDYGESIQPEALFVPGSAALREFVAAMREGLEGFTAAWSVRCEDCTLEGDRAPSVGRVALASLESEYAYENGLGSGSGTLRLHMEELRQAWQSPNAHPLPDRVEQTATVSVTRLDPLPLWEAMVQQLGGGRLNRAALATALNTALAGKPELTVSVGATTDTAGGGSASVTYAVERPMRDAGSLAALFSLGAGNDAQMWAALGRIALEVGRLEASGQITHYRHVVAAINAASQPGQGEMLVLQLSPYLKQDGANLAGRLLVQDGQVELNGERVPELEALLADLLQAAPAGAVAPRAPGQKASGVERVRGEGPLGAGAGAESSVSANRA